MKSCGDKINELQKVDKVLRALSVKFDHIVVAIEESNYLTKMNLEELQEPLDAHKLRFK